MSTKRKNGPKGSEIPIMEWLTQIRAENVQYVGSKDQDGPPDWVIEYEGETVAIEVCLLHNSPGWGKTREVAFERELAKLIEEEESVPGAKARQWHVRCEYDPRVSKSSIRKQQEWKSKARKALRTPGLGGEFQLLSPGSRIGRGVILELTPASSKGSFAGVSVDEGYIVEETLTERIIAETRKKTEKVRNGGRASSYSQWWLVFDDEVLIAPIEVLAASDQARIDTMVQNSIDRKLWSKIIVVSRFQPVHSPRKLAKWFWAPSEDDRHPRLPRASPGG